MIETPLDAAIEYSSDFFSSLQQMLTKKQEMRSKFV